MHSVKQDYTIYNDKYKKVKVLGKGAFGTVYLVEELNDQIEEDNSGEKSYNNYSMKKFYLDNVSQNILNCSQNQKTAINLSCFNNLNY
jgi:hypothetical protein